MFFDSYCQSLLSRRKTGHYAASPIKFDIFKIFSNFLRLQVLRHAATREATRVPNLLY